MISKSSGWVKLHRKLRDNPIYKNSKAVHCWIECLLRASHTGSCFYAYRQKVALEPGQFVMGREEFGANIGISGSTAWFWLAQFEVDSMVDIKKTSKGSIVTIKKWKDYQGVDIKPDNRKTTNEQQMNTNKNDKNEKNILFERFWNLYDKKIGKPKCERKWKRLSEKDQQAIMEYIPKYKKAQPDQRYRKNPETFLNNQSWEDTLIYVKDLKPQPAAPQYKDFTTSKFSKELSGKLKA